MKIKSLLILFLFSIFTGFAQELALARVDEQEGFGYITKTGEWHIKPQFKSAKNFYDDLAQAMGDNDKWGYINRSGEWQIEPQFDRAKGFNSGIAVVLKDDRWFFINKNGEEILKDVKTEKIYDFESGFSIIKQGDKIGFINSEGKVIVEPKFDKAYDFVNGYARVKVGDDWGLIDSSGAYYVEPTYKRIGDFFTGNVVAQQHDGIVGLIINNKFSPVKGADKIWDFEYDEEYSYARKDKKFGFINSKGEWVIQPTYDKVRAFRNGLAPVMQNKKWGYINSKGETIIPLEYRDAEIFSEDGLAPVKEKKLWAFINDKGELITEYDYEISSGGWIGSAFAKKRLSKYGLVIPNFGYIDGFTRVKFDKKWGFLDTQGKLLKDQWFINVEPFM